MLPVPTRRRRGANTGNVERSCDEETCHAFRLAARSQDSARLCCRYGYGKPSVVACLVTNDRHLGLDTTIANQLYHHLKTERYVVATTGSRKAGFAASGKPYFVPVKDGPNHQKMLGNLFDPMLHISHQVRLHISEMSSGPD